MCINHLRRTLGSLGLSGAVIAGWPVTEAGATGRAVLHVDDDAPLGGNGQSWSTAHRYLRDALLAASMPGSGVVEIRVGGGVYRPDLDEAGIAIPGSTSSTFALLAGVSVRGGYAGFGAPDPDLRDTVLHETVLSGELGGPNSYHVVVGSGVGPDAVLDGVSVADGRAVGSCCSNDRGGGLSLVGGGATFVECTFRSNISSTSGGAVWISNSSPTFTDCVFEENASSSGTGAIHAAFGSKVTLIRCNVRGNDGSTVSGGPGTHGAIFIGGNATGAVPSVLVAFDTDFTQNTGVGGGAIYVAGSATLVNCLFAGNIANGNTVYFDTGRGGAISSYGQVTATNCTFFGNSATFSGGAVHASRSGLDTTLPSWFVLENCILWGNTSGAEDEADQVHVVGNSTLTLDHCCLEGPLPAAAGVGSFSGDPLFVDELGPDGQPASGDEDFRPGRGSPCVDAGDSAAVPAGVVLDLAGLPRFRDDPAAADCPNAPGTCGAAPIVDIGAFERQPPCIGDLDSDGVVAASDVALLIAAWGISNDGDLDGDGVAGSADLGLLLAAWGECAP